MLVRAQGVAQGYGYGRRGQTQPVAVASARTVSRVTATVHAQLSRRQTEYMYLYFVGALK